MLFFIKKIALVSFFLYIATKKRSQIKRQPQQPTNHKIINNNKEVSKGRIIGQGGFSIVSEINHVDLDEVNDTNDDQERLRKAFASSSNDESQERPLFVLKTLRDDLPEEEQAKGIVDLAIEAEFLAVLSHPHIISMRAMANCDPHSTRFFVVLDRLTTTLDRKFNYWRKVVGENVGMWWGPCIGYCCAKKHELNQLWLERLGVARDIAKAIEYLHGQKIIYRYARYSDEKCTVLD